MRPATLVAVASRTAVDGNWSHHLNEFLDDFYAADLDLARQTAMIADAPVLLGKSCPDAILGGAGEHLARRWGLPVPRWVRHEARYLDRAMYWPDAEGFRGYLLAVSPVAFRTRCIFTGPDPLQRARFPYARGTISLPYNYPVCPTSA